MPGRTDDTYDHQDENIMKRFALTLFVLPLIFAACSDSTVAPTVNLGETTLSDFEQNTGYQVWYNPGYEAFPLSEDQADFQTAVTDIQTMVAAGGEGAYKVIMVVKPNCGCQATKVQMPQVVKTLDEAGFAREDIEVWVTDNRLAGLDDLTSTFSVNAAPTFIVVKNGAETGRVVLDDTIGAETATELAAAFGS